MWRSYLKAHLPVIYQDKIRFIFDGILCSHVLEHVPDDRRALGEFYRVLKPGGWAVLNVPIEGETTMEDPSVDSPKERLRRYGQEDHVRLYGADYGQRLSAAGFQVTVPDFRSWLSAAQIERYRLAAEGQEIEPLHVGSKRAAHSC